MDQDASRPAGPITRRSALLGLTAAWTLAGLYGGSSLALAAAPTERRLVVVILRGALDGMSAVCPYGDKDLAILRPDLLLPPPGKPGGLLDLGGFFGLHPALSEMHAMYAVGQMLPIHAVAGPYRSRSHFQAQDMLESGADHGMSSGWLNRAIAASPIGDAGKGGGALALGLDVPLILRGPATVGSWTEKRVGRPEADLYARLAALSEHDPVLGPAFSEGLHERQVASGILDKNAPDQAGKRPFVTLAGAAGALLAAPGGPRIAALELGGWDTHARQTARLNGTLGQLDEGLKALKDGLGQAWKDTAVLVMTEFGRTVRTNGTGGTDHGTGTIAFVLGGDIRGGRVMANWPGLKRHDLYEDRDLQPTTDLRSIAKGLLSRHMLLSEAALAAAFPGGGAAPAEGLVIG